MGVDKAVIKGESIAVVLMKIKYLWRYNTQRLFDIVLSP